MSSEIEQLRRNNTQQVRCWFRMDNSLNFTRREGIRRVSTGVKKVGIGCNQQRQANLSSGRSHIKVDRKRGTC